MASNPIVTVDWTNHPLYSTTDHYAWKAKKWKAEVLIWNINSGTMRIRLLDDDGTLVTSNVEVDIAYIVEDELNIAVR